MKKLIPILLLLFGGCMIETYTPPPGPTTYLCVETDWYVSHINSNMNECLNWVYCWYDDCYQCLIWYDGTEADCFGFYE